MLKPSGLRKAFRIVLFLMTCLITTGCYTMRTISVTTIPKITEVIIVHADKNSWTIINYSVTDSLLTGQISQGKVNATKTKTVHVYVAPVSAVTVKGSTLTVPLLNIAKTDCQELNIIETLGFGIIWVSLLFTLTMIVG